MVMVVMDPPAAPLDPDDDDDDDDDGDDDDDDGDDFDGDGDDDGDDDDGDGNDVCGLVSGSEAGPWHLKTPRPRANRSANYGTTVIQECLPIL